jgi:hypothetical protein
MRYRTDQQPVLPGCCVAALVLALVDRRPAHGHLDHERLLAETGKRRRTGRRGRVRPCPETVHTGEPFFLKCGLAAVAAVAIKPKTATAAATISTRVVMRILNPPSCRACPLRVDCQVSGVIGRPPLSRLGRLPPPLSPVWVGVSRKEVVGRSPPHASPWSGGSLVPQWP